MWNDSCLTACHVFIWQEPSGGTCARQWGSWRTFRPPLCRSCQVYIRTASQTPGGGSVFQFCNPPCLQCVYCGERLVDRLSPKAYTPGQALQSHPSARMALVSTDPVPTLPEALQKKQFEQMSAHDQARSLSRSSILGGCMGFTWGVSPQPPPPPGLGGPDPPTCQEGP